MTPPLPPRPGLDPFYIRATHGSAYRSGQWAKVIGIGMVEAKGAGVNVCYLVLFVDGAEHYWPVYDTAAGYEFS